MISAQNGTLLTLTGGVVLKRRVQHPKVHERKDRGTFYWFFRYRHDEITPDGSIMTRRKFHTIGPSRGDNRVSKRQAEVARDEFLANLNAAPSRCEATVRNSRPVEFSAILFGGLAQMWRADYVDNPKVKLAAPTREKYRNRLDVHILPRWKDTRLGEFRTKDTLDWLQSNCSSWHMMVDLRNIMSGIFTCAQEWQILPETFANPMSRVKVGRKWTVRPNRILTELETAEVFEHLDAVHLLICKTCLHTGARISEVLGRQLKHFDPEKGAIRIEQRHCRGDVDEPKTSNSKRTLALGALIDEYRAWISARKITRADEWLFFQADDRTKPMWDSGVRKALKHAAQKAGCDFRGFGLHSFRRANITMRQEEGGSAIEASKIAGHATVNMTGDYTVVRLKRQEELTRAIQDRLSRAREQQFDRITEQTTRIAN